jgi:hypothetical protein
LLVGVSLLWYMAVPDGMSCSGVKYEIYQDWLAMGRIIERHFCQLLHWAQPGFSKDALLLLSKWSSKLKPY